jgi:predicted CxxxxCH...CXXCH cytochrome family protein
MAVQATATPEGPNEQIEIYPLIRGAPFRADAEMPFLHRMHLGPDFDHPQRGSNNDCTRCHVFQGGDAADYQLDPKSCDTCHLPGHIGNSALRQELLRLEQREPGRTSGPFFDHTTSGHSRKRCLHCHPAVQSVVTIGDRQVPEIEFEVGKSLSSCASMECHSDHNQSASRPLVSEWLKTTGDGKECSQCHISDKIPLPGDRPAAGKFRHKDHLRPDETLDPDDPSQCQRCHQKVTEVEYVQADNYQEMFFEAEGCGECHQTLGSEGLRPMALAAPQPEEKRRAHANFNHELHWRDTGVKRKGSCLASGCHQFNSAQEPEVPGYNGCVVCHMTSRVENHGSGALCSECHAGVFPRDGEEALMRTEPVRRHRDSNFHLLSMHHPEITSLGKDLGAVDRCDSCHRAKLPALIRTRGRRFEHPSHLPGNPDQEDCLQCHMDIRSSEDSRTAAAFSVAAHQGDSSCAKCHQGSEIQLSDPIPTEVPYFSHKDHLEAPPRSQAEGGLRALRCGDCHTASAGDYTIPGPESCKSCHGHQDPAKAAITGGKDALVDRDKCQQCHQALPSADADFDPQHQFVVDDRILQRTHAMLSGEPQFHDQSGDCAHCHGHEGKSLAPLFSRVTVGRRQSPHGHSKTIYNATGDCANCHLYRQPRR